MIVKIQIYISHYFGKLVSLALILFVLTSFNLQVLTANAQGAVAPIKSVTSTTATKPIVASNNLTDKQVSEKIGALKNCSVDNKSADYQKKLKEDPTEANNFIFQCLKDIIQIVITISVILAIMKLIFVGIKFLNTFGDEKSLTTELSNTISGFVVGAIILGLFAAIINVINPSALKIDKIFSAQVIADYKCLNKGITDKNAATVNKSNCKNYEQGNSETGVVTGASIKTLFDETKPSEDQKKEKLRIVEEVKKCLSNSSIVLATAQEVNNCKPYLKFYAENPNQESFKNLPASSVDSVIPPSYNTDIFANGTYKVITNDEINVTITYTQIGSKKQQKFTLFYNDECEKTPFDNEVKEIAVGGQLNFAPCILTITKDK